MISLRNGLPLHVTNEAFEDWSDLGQGCIPLQYCFPECLSKYIFT